MDRQRRGTFIPAAALSPAGRLSEARKHQTLFHLPFPMRKREYCSTLPPALQARRSRSKRRARPFAFSKLKREGLRLSKALPCSLCNYSSSSSKARSGSSAGSSAGSSTLTGASGVCAAAASARSTASILSASSGWSRKYWRAFSRPCPMR